MSVQLNNQPSAKMIKFVFQMANRINDKMRKVTEWPNDQKNDFLNKKFLWKKISR